MEPIVRSNHHVRFRAFSLDPQTRELFRNGVKQRIHGQPIELLSILIAHPGELVTREILQKALWPGDTFVDFEHSLNSNIKRLREALGDDPGSPLFIETVPRLGYRFIAPVQAPDEPAPVSAPAQSPAEPVGHAPSIPPPDESATKQATSIATHRAWVWLIAGVGLASLAAVAIWYIRRPLPPPRITEYVQITNDGISKGVWGAAGNTLFLNLWQPGGIAQVSASGGRVTRIPIDLPSSRDYPNDNLTLYSVSPDGSNFLVGGHVTTNVRGWTEADLWVVGLAGHPARYLTRAVSASWSPDGKFVLYSTAHGDIYTIPAEGGQAHMVLPSSAPSGENELVSYIKWSPDGKTIRFARNDRIWQVDANGNHLHELLPGWHPSDPMCCLSWTPDENFFLFVSGPTIVPGLIWVTGAQIWALDERRAPGRAPKMEPILLTSGPTLWTDLIASSASGKVFSRGITRRGELVRFDPKSKQLEPYLSGTSAEYVDFSRNGRYLAYVTFPEGILWRANRDGTGLLQLTSPPVHPKNIRWSPDGTQILFHDTLPSRQEAMFTVSSQGGTPIQLIADKSVEGADPTWSPDGERVLYSEFAGNTMGKPPSTHILDLRTHSMTTLPRSPEVFWSPRWSPDGRYAAGLTIPGEDLEIFDFKTNEWSILHPHQGQIRYPSWSHDGRSIYYLIGPYWTGVKDIADPGVYRIPVTGGKPEKVVDLKGFRHTGYYSFWMGLDPDDNPLLLRDEGTDEIYALTLEEK